MKMFVWICVVAFLLSGCAAKSVPATQPEAPEPTSPEQARQVSQWLDEQIRAVAAWGGEFAVLQQTSMHQAFRGHLINNVNPMLGEINEGFLAREFLAFKAGAPSPYVLEQHRQQQKQTQQQQQQQPKSSFWSTISDLTKALGPALIDSAKPPPPMNVPQRPDPPTYNYRPTVPSFMPRK